MSEMLDINSNLSHYRILEKIGAGGMGEVYLAEDLKLNRKVALKVLPENITQDDERMRRFIREAKSASALNHPNIITIYEIGEIDSTHFIAAEYIEGESLRDGLKRKPLDLQTTLDIAVQAAAALDAAHRAGIIHRDIKPDNVMLRPDGLVKLLDFGIAKLIEEKSSTEVDAEAPTAMKIQTTPGTVVGTANYMSPEQAKGKDIDARTDIFSFGIMLFEMLSGKLPFEGESAIDVIGAILHKEPAPLNQTAPELPRELRHIVEKCLRKDREERYQTARDLLIDLKDIKRELEFQSKVDRTAAPLQEEPKTQILNAASDSPSPKSSAEYIVNRIENHKPAAVISLAVLLAATLGLGYWFFQNRFGHTKRIESIAVLPFINTGGNTEVEYLSDGMTETLITSLSQIPDLTVKARSSVFRYKGKEIDPNKIGRELGVQAVLTGNVLQRGNELTLFVELVDTNAEKVLWSENYNRPLANLLLLQTEIARDVSRKLQARLSGADEQKLANFHTENAEAYQLYLKGRFFWSKRTEKDIQKAIEFFQQAVAVDPNYALAYAGLADAYALLPTYGPTPSREVLPKAREAALKALSLDSQLAEAHISVGIILNFYDYDFAGAEREFKTAIELNPASATAHHFYGNLLSTQGRHEEGLAELRRAIELDPLMLIANRLYGLGLFYAGKLDEAVAQLKKTIELDASFAPAYDTLAAVYMVKGNYAESVEAYARNKELTGDYQNALLARQSFARDGWTGFLRAMTASLAQTKADPYQAATFYAALGEKDKAFAELDEAYENREFFMILLKVDPRLDSLRDDPRFQKLMRKIVFP